MKKDEIKVGGTYLAKVSDRVVPVRIDAEFGGHLGSHSGGPGEDGVALLLGEAVHQQQGAGLVDQLAAALVEPAAVRKGLAFRLALRRERRRGTVGLY